MARVLLTNAPTMIEKARGWLSGVLFMLTVAAGCGETRTSAKPDASAESMPDGGEPQGGSEGTLTADATAGAGGERPVCDCGDDPMFVHAPLDCACAAGYCKSVDLNAKFRRDEDYGLGWPYVVLVGECKSGHRVMWQMEACENGSRSVYDENGKLVYSSEGPYGGPPAVCGRPDADFGDFGIGEVDPSRSCDYCVLAEHGESLDTGGAANTSGAGGAAGEAGAGGAANPGFDPNTCYASELEQYPPCSPEWYQ